MSDSAERNGDGDGSLKPEGTNSTRAKHSSGEWRMLPMENASSSSEGEEEEDEAGDIDEAGGIDEDGDIEFTRGNYDRSYFQGIFSSQMEYDTTSSEGEEEEDDGGNIPGCCCSHCGGVQDTGDAGGNYEG